jgi:raffinose/stachyose/melibiose transport system substrate-binding protein
MKTAIEAFDEIINDMPESEAAFAVAQEALISRMRTERTTGYDILYSYIMDRELGVTEPRDKAVYEVLQTLTLADVKAAQEKWVKNRTYHYGILGDIKDLDTLIKVAEDINSKVDAINEEFGYELTGAFASAGLDDGSSWRFSGHLANMPLYYEFLDDGVDPILAGEAEIDGTYLDNYKKVWDLYVSTSSADPKTLNSGALNAESELGMEEAVFYQNGDWEFAPLTNPENGYLVTADDLSMLPIYFGVDDANEGLCVGTESMWAVNAKASQEDIDASLAFLDWMITSDEGRACLTEDMGLSCPFDTFTGDFASKNPFGAEATELMNEGKTSVAWAFNATPNVDDWRAGVVAALTAYTDGTGDWEAVKTAFVDGWAEQWKLAEEAAAE